MRQIFSAAAAFLAAATARARAIMASPAPVPVDSPAFDLVGFPVGLWRCTHTSEPFAKDFVPGQIYPCYLEAGTLSRRIYPRPDSRWAPYWEPHNQRFCYPPSQLRFEYVGPHPS